MTTSTWFAWFVCGWTSLSPAVNSPHMEPWKKQLPWEYLGPPGHILFAVSSLEWFIFLWAVLMNVSSLMGRRKAHTTGFDSSCLATLYLAVSRRANVSMNPRYCLFFGKPNSPDGWVINLIWILDSILSLHCKCNFFSPYSYRFSITRILPNMTSQSIDFLFGHVMYGLLASILL